MDIQVNRVGAVDEPVFRNGDFLLGESDHQHIQDIVESFPGWWKEFVLLGVGIQGYNGSSGKEQEIQTQIALMLRSDGYQVNAVEPSYTPEGTLNMYVDAIRN